jgi:single-strand DNA-binding protein
MLDESERAEWTHEGLKLARAAWRTSLQTYDFDFDQVVINVVMLHYLERIKINESLNRKSSKKGRGLLMRSNLCIFIGRLSKDVELRYTQSGQAVAKFSLAVTRDVPNQNNEREVDFLNFVIWGKPAITLADNVTKGDMIAVESRCQTRSYEGQNGKKVYVTEFVVTSYPKFLKLKKWENDNNQSRGYNNQQSNGYPNDPFSNERPIEISDDDLPF